MSTIISASLSESDIQALDAIQKQLGLKGRSETIRAGLRSLAAEQRERQKLSGVIEAALLIVHDEHGSGTVTKALHEHQQIIKTHVHHHVEQDRCLEILVLKGNAEKIRALVEIIQSNKATHTARLVVC